MQQRDRLAFVELSIHETQIFCISAFGNEIAGTVDRFPGILYNIMLKNQGLCPFGGYCL